MWCVLTRGSTGQMNQLAKLFKNTTNIGTERYLKCNKNKHCTRCNSIKCRHNVCVHGDENTIITLTHWTSTCLDCIYYACKYSLCIQIEPWVLLSFIDLHSTTADLLSQNSDDDLILCVCRRHGVHPGSRRYTDTPGESASGPWKASWSAKCPNVLYAHRRRCRIHRSRAGQTLPVGVVLHGRQCAQSSCRRTCRRRTDLPSRNTKTIPSENLPAGCVADHGECHQSHLASINIIKGIDCRWSFACRFRRQTHTATVRWVPALIVFERPYNIPNALWPRSISKCHALSAIP